MPDRGDQTPFENDQLTPDLFGLVHSVSTAPQIDQILDLFGPPQRVTGFVRNSRLLGHLEVPDSFLVHREFFVNGGPPLGDAPGLQY